MTDQARARAEKIVHHDYDWVANHDLSWLKAQIALALAQAQRETWLTVAEMVEREQPGNDWLSGWCRQQASKEER